MQLIPACTITPITKVLSGQCTEVFVLASKVIYINSEEKHEIMCK